MANTKSAIKRVRSAERRRLRNRQFRTQARTYVRKARTLIAAGQVDAAKASVNDAIRALDVAASKGIIHANTAARRKSRLMEAFNRASQAQEA